MKKWPFKVNSSHVVGALMLASAGLVIAGPKQGHVRHVQPASQGHGNSDFGHRQGDPASRTRGSQNSEFGHHHKDALPASATAAQPSASAKVNPSKKENRDNDDNETNADGD